MHVSVCVCVCPTSLLPYTTSQWSDVFAKCFGFKHYRLTVAIEQVHRCKSYEVKEKSQGGKKTESLLDSNWSQPNLLKQKTASERSSAQRSHILCTFQQAKKYNSIWFFVHFLFWRFLSHGFRSPKLEAPIYFVPLISIRLYFKIYPPLCMSTAWSIPFLSISNLCL